MVETTIKIYVSIVKANDGNAYNIILLSSDSRSVG